MIPNVSSLPAFQQDGVPCNFSLRVREFLNEKFLQLIDWKRWPLFWPPRS